MIHIRSRDIYKLPGGFYAFVQVEYPVDASVTFGPHDSREEAEKASEDRAVHEAVREREQITSKGNYDKHNTTHIR
jgi:hypothetical protein